MHGNVTAQRNIAVAAVAADSGHLDRALVDVHVVDLIRFGRRIGARDRDIDWSIDRDTDIDEAPREVTAATIARAVAPGCDRVGAAAQAREEDAAIPAHCNVAAAAMSPHAGHL